MKKLYNRFIKNEFHIDYLFNINSFLLRNEISIKEIEKVLRVAYDTANLYQTRSNLKAEIEELKQIKNNLQCSQTNRHPPIKPLPKPFNWNY
ncbi:MAG TPA: hypothetical protein VFK40_04090 [Nitrososphaeraceae archaeon]|nr:hypothetical protein [Nitrososphaeraceae archaeon]